MLTGRNDLVDDAAVNKWNKLFRLVYIIFTIIFANTYCSYLSLQGKSFNFYFYYELKNWYRFNSINNKWSLLEPFNKVFWLNFMTKGESIFIFFSFFISFLMFFSTF